MNLSDLSNVRLPQIKHFKRIIAIIIALCGAAYLYWTSTTKVPGIEAKTAAKETENASLTETERNLTTLYNEMDFYLNETTRLYDETEKILEQFPTFMYLEDKILYADTLLKTDLRDYNLSQFSYGQSEYVASVTYGPTNNQMELYSVNMSGVYSDLTYTQIKEILDYGLSSTQRFVLNNITIGYNEQSGYLSGQFSFKTYFIPGQATPYEFPDNVVVGLGGSNRVNNLFGSREAPAEPTEEETPIG